MKMVHKNRHLIVCCIPGHKPGILIIQIIESSFSAVDHKEPLPEHYYMKIGLKAYLQSDSSSIL